MVPADPPDLLRGPTTNYRARRDGQLLFGGIPFLLLIPIVTVVGGT